MPNLPVKTIIYTALALITLMAAAGYIADKKMVSFLDRKLPSHITLTYDELDTDILQGSVTLSGIHIESSDPLDDSLMQRVTAHELKLRDLSYYDFFIRDRISADNLDIVNPVLTTFSYESSLDSTHEHSRGSVQLKKTITIGEFNLVNATILSLEPTLHDTTDMICGLDLSLAELVVDSITVNKQIPFRWNDIELFWDSALFAIGPYERMLIGETQLDIDHQQIINSISIASIPTRQELIRTSPEEREHLDIFIPQLAFDQLIISVQSDTLLLSADLIQMDHIDMNIHLDKRPTDRTAYKPLYAKALRSMGIYLAIDSVDIGSSFVSYEEKLEEPPSLARLEFDSVNIGISNLSNLPTNNKLTKAELATRFMGSSPMQLFYNFQVNHPEEEFNAAIELQDFNISDAAGFFRAHANTQPSGHIDHLLVEIRANDIQSLGQMKMEYSDLSFKIYKEGMDKVARVKTFVSDLMIKEDSSSGDSDYRKGDISVQRERDRSFFNYLWLNVRNGLKSVLLGTNSKSSDE